MQGSNLAANPDLRAIRIENPRSARTLLFLSAAPGTFFFSQKNATALTKAIDLKFPAVPRHRTEDNKIFSIRQILSRSEREDAV